MKKAISFIVAVFALVAFSSSAALADAPAAFNKCKACHKTDSDNSKWTVGPGMQGIGKRLSKDYLGKWLTDPQATFDAGGAEIEALKKGDKFKTPLKMPSVTKTMTPEDRAALIDYLGTL
ncbi:MAG: cytochrome c [Nitrospinae bacterium]|nr:cytochrome c [Nitrospinota bacterium]